MIHTQIPQGLNPLSPEQAQQFSQLIGTMTPVQQAWVGGYLAASAQTASVVPQAPAAVVDTSPLTILYGSQTGNAKHVAADLAKGAKARGITVKLVDMADYKLNQLKTEKHLAIVVATYGEGEPPESAEKFFNYIGSKKAPKLNGAKIAVLGLGDSSYEFFNKTAVDFEERLSALGATVAVERALLDVDYDDHAPVWIAGALDTLEPLFEAAPGSGGTNVVAMPGVQPVTPTASVYSKKNPFAAEVIGVQKITGRDSTKDVRHVELSLEGSGLRYQPGDSLGVYFQNDAAQVDDLIAALNLDPAAQIMVGTEAKALRDALINDFELTQSYPAFVEKYGTATKNADLVTLAEDKSALRTYIAERQIFDILRDHPGDIAPQALIDALRKMQPRLYSIASSQAEVEDEVHLTVGVVEWDAFDQAHLGGCSGYLGRRLAEGDILRIFVESNDNFRLPQDPATPVIMVGPGTGIAPFRAFLQEREAQEAEGQNWLFFGNPNFTQDFLYQVELQSHLKSGLLTQLGIAFSRDQKSKVYVQDKIKELGEQLFALMQAGAHVYVCGDGSRMAKDVHAVLLQIVQEYGGLSEAASVDYLENLRDQRRYQKDVY